MLNNISLVGRLTREPELYNGKNDSKVSNFSLAFAQGVNADGSDNTGFIDCKAFNKIAETIQEWLVKGDKVAISGRITEEKFTRKDGSKGSKHLIIVDSLEFIDVLKSKTEETPEEELPFEKEEPKPEPKPVAKPQRNRR